MKDKCISTYYQPKTGAKCYCKRGIERDNCPNCEGTGWVIDFRAIRERHETKLKSSEVFHHEINH